MCWNLSGKPQFTHVGEILDGVDMRAEVALLSRNILIHGEMENSCYGKNWCQYFSYDTFGGHIKVCLRVSVCVCVCERLCVYLTLSCLVLPCGEIIGCCMFGLAPDN